MDVIQTSRRSFITGLVSLVAAPAIVRIESLMKLPVPTPLIMRPINNLLTPAMITRYAVRMWKDSNFFLTDPEIVAIRGDMLLLKPGVTAAA